MPARSALAGFLIAPLAAPVVLAAIIMAGLWAELAGHAAEAGWLNTLVGMAFGTLFGLLSVEFATFYSYTWTTLLGVPIHFLLRFCGLTSWVWYAACGLVAGAGVFARWVTPSAWQRLADEGAIYLAAGTLHGDPNVFLLLGGPINALTFWLIVRPDRALPQVAASG